jgi:uncharacterized DUF497 family protein
MDIEFDAAKDAANMAKHGVSLALGASMDIDTAVIDRDDRRNYGEVRFNALGRIEGRVYAMTFTVRDSIRIISLRKANPREQRRFAR